MKALALSLLLALAPAAAALEVSLRQAIALDRPGVTAAFAVDPDVAEVSVRDGRVTITGRHAGETTVTLVGSSGVESWPLVVEAPPLLALVRGAAREEGGGFFGTEYDSQTTRITSVLDLTGLQGSVRYRLHAGNVTWTTARPADSAQTTFPSLALELSSGGRSFVLFDETVRSTPLTLDGSTVRGIHVRAGGLELHAGTTAATLFEDVLLPSDGEKAFGASWRLASGRSAFTPSVYLFPTESTTGGTKGAMASLLFSHGDASGPLRLRAEAGWGGKPGGAFDLEWAGAKTQLTLGFLHLPQEFASIGIGRPHGTFADAAYTGSISRRVSFALDGSYGRHELPGLSQTTGYGRGDLRAVVARGVSFSAGATASLFAPESGSGEVRSLTFPLGVSLASGPWALDATYRYQRNSATNQGGNGGRLSLRHGSRRFFASAFFDLQRDVPTLELVFRESPELERLFAELGIVVRTPEDVSRVLRENPALAQLGYVEGVTLRLDPTRLQAGADAGIWLGGSSSQQIRLHAVLDRAEGIDTIRETRIATLTYSRRIGDLVDVTVGGSFWRNESGGVARNGSSLLVGLRKTFDGPPRLPFGTRGAVEGIVRREEPGGMSAPAEGVEVRLDGMHGAITDSRGRFVFPGVPRGPHRVEAVLPPGAASYFTTPSSVVAETGSDVSFGITSAAAHLLGTLRDEEGEPVAGVRVRVASAAGTQLLATDGQGEFRLATADGEAEASLSPESLPAGYQAGSLSRCSVALVRAAPSRCDLVVTATRSVGGRVTGADPARSVIRLVELDRSVAPDASGAWLFRGLPSGTFTIVAESDGLRRSREVVVPRGPATIRGFELAMPKAEAVESGRPPHR